ncbi:MAG: Vi polysaccharide biosynthesis UDP-N-acetylglucosamine C-6 dehydrogenase TviB [Wenzhouxiangellaceae bacterium]
MPTLKTPAGQAPHIALIGLGYVGLPLALELARHYPVLGFDIDPGRVEELAAGHDRTCEAEAAELSRTSARFSADERALDQANVYIVTVPTPIDEHKRPDLTPLLAASRTVGRHLKSGDVVIFESTVYPGCTEEDCVPILERESGLKCALGDASGANHSSDAGHFQVGYSPERINPGDRQHRLPNIRKVTSGGTPEAADFVDALYASIITAGTHKAPSIRVAEAAKVIENTQRDVNIALINELAMLFGRMGIDTAAVLEAAGTKWNFLPFRPGLVGGHCIGVDPYYLTHKAQQMGFHPQMILAGRRINDGMGPFVAGELVRLMARRRIYRPGARVLVLGLTFKENCPDLRNTRVVDLIATLKEYSLEVDVHDPWADADEARRIYGLELTDEPKPGDYDAVVVAVAHQQFRELPPPGVRAWCRPDAVVYDLKHILPPEIADARL